MEWKPWEDFCEAAKTLPITEPPCRDCASFRPHRTYDNLGNFAGVVICTKIGEQCNDFSCYRPKK